MHLSVIVPTLSKPQTAALLAGRISDLLPALSIETIVVLPAGAERPPDTPTVRFVSHPVAGVYMAYRAGLQYATGEYCWFIGDDDYPLDGAKALGPAMLAAKSDVLVAPVVFSTGRLYAATRSLLILHFLNWCQQGVIYRRKLFERFRFFRRLRVQADQYVNIRLRADPGVRITFLSDPICVFGVDGLSGRLVDSGYSRVRWPLARRTLGQTAFLGFCILSLVRPLAKRVIKLR